MQKYSLKFLLVGFVLMLSACGVLTSEPIDETKTWSAPKLYAEARSELQGGNFEKAISLFEKLESRYPFGTFATQAQMEIAYAYYRQGDQAQATAAVDRFIKLHPGHPNVDYMYYLRGLITFNDKVGLFNFIAPQDLSERDPKGVRDAYDSFRILADKFPNSQYAADANGRLAYLVNAMAQYDVHVANYYYRRGAYLAAANRAQTAVKEFNQAPAVEEALFIMVRSYDALGMTDLRDDADRVFRTNFPNSKYLQGPEGKKSAWWKVW